MNAKNVYKELMLECEIRGFTKRTVQSCRNTVLHFLRFLSEKHQIEDIEEINTVHIRDFLRFQQKKGCKATYINGLHKTLMSMYIQILR